VDQQHSSKPASASASAFASNPYPGVFGPPPGIVNGASGSTWGNPAHATANRAVWGAPSVNGWGPPPPARPPVAPKPDRGTIISDRARIAFEKLATATSPSDFFMAGDLHQVSVTLFPDNASVGLREFVESCHASGKWAFRQEHGRLLMRFDPTNAGMQPSVVNPAAGGGQGMRTY
jgi:hypothetical protein